jgi:hypothetical protein
MLTGYRHYWRQWQGDGRGMVMKTVEVLTGLPGCGKSHDLRAEAVKNPGLYLFAYPSIALIAEQVVAFETETQVPVVEAHSEAPGGGTVQNRLERHKAHFEANSIAHAIVLITHEGLMGADLSAFGQWNVRIDEVPNTIQSGVVHAPASAASLKRMIAIDPVGSHGWGELRLLDKPSGWNALANDDLFRPLAEMMKQATRRHGVFVDTLDWKDSFGWCSVWPIASLAHCQSLKIAAASFEISLGTVVAKQWEAARVKFDTKKRSRRRTGKPAVRVHYFTQSHEGSTAFWATRRGSRFIVKICDFLAAKEPALGFWAANEGVERLLDHRLNGKPISPKAAGLNVHDDETSCALIYSSKAMPTDDPVQKLFGITDQEILRAREEEDIFQFVMRGAIRKPEFGGDYDIYLYSKRQAELVADKFTAAGVGRSVDLVPEPGAGIMDAARDPMEAIRDAIRQAWAAKAAKRRIQADSDRKREVRGLKADADGRTRSANGGRGGRPAGSKDKQPRKPRAKP